MGKDEEVIQEEIQAPEEEQGIWARRREVLLYFLRLGFTGFGGPAAHIALMHDEIVRKRKWVSEQQFLDLLGATNLIPGPTSTEMAIHLGYVRAGWVGLILGGLGFILPAMAIVFVFAYLYVRYGSTPEVGWALYGIKPVVIGIVADALVSLGRKAIRGPLTAAAGLGVLGLYFLGVDELVLLISGAVLVMLIENVQLRQRPALPAWLPGLWEPFALVAGAPFSLGLLFLTFLKIGVVLFGSGYVLLAFLRADFVERLGWLTDTQLIDAVAVGQVTPGPLFTTATFIGYLLGGIPGGLVATLGIFLPSFLLVALTNPWIGRMREWRWTASMLDGVNAAALGLMAAVTIELGRAAFQDWFSPLLSLVAFGLVFSRKINPTWVVLGGALVGFIRAMLGGM